jgi:hypothetical protein
MTSPPNGPPGIAGRRRGERTSFLRGHPRTRRRERGMGGRGDRGREARRERHCPATAPGQSAAHRVPGHACVPAAPTMGGHRSLRPVRRAPPDDGRIRCRRAGACLCRARTSGILPERAWFLVHRIPRARARQPFRPVHGRHLRSRRMRPTAHFNCPRPPSMARLCWISTARPTCRVPTPTSRRARCRQPGTACWSRSKRGRRSRTSAGDLKLEKRCLQAQDQRCGC